MDKRAVERKHTAWQDVVNSAPPSGWWLGAAVAGSRALGRASHSRFPCHRGPAISPVEGPFFVALIFFFKSVLFPIFFFYIFVGFEGGG